MKGLLHEDVGFTNTEAWEEFFESINQVEGKQWLFALGVLLVLLLVSHFVMRVIKKRLQKSNRISKSLHTVIVTLARYLLVMLSFMLAGNAVGISLSAFLVVFGVLGAAIALAAQGILSNIAGCMILLSGRLFEVEDYIETPSGAGTVKEINLLNTKLLSYEGHTIYIPNSVLYTEAVTNLTSNGKRRANISFRVSAAYSPDAVREAAFAAVAKNQYALDDPEPILVVNGYSPGHVNYLLLCWAKSENYWPMRNGVNELLWSALKERGIEMTDKSVSVLLSDS